MISYRFKLIKVFQKLGFHDKSVFECLHYYPGLERIWNDKENCEPLLETIDSKFGFKKHFIIKYVNNEFKKIKDKRFDNFEQFLEHFGIIENYYDQYKNVVKHLNNSSNNYLINFLIGIEILYEKEFSELCGCCEKCKNCDCVNCRANYNLDSFLNKINNSTLKKNINVNKLDKDNINTWAPSYFSI